MASSSRSQVSAFTYTDMPPHELERLWSADSSTLTQQEHDKLMNTVVRVDLDDLVDHINHVRAGDNTVLNLLALANQTSTCAMYKYNRVRQSHKRGVPHLALSAHDR